MDNDRRADIGQSVVVHGARQTNVYAVEEADVSVQDVLAYVAHFCKRLGLDPHAQFDRALFSFDADEEDGPFTAATMDPSKTLKELIG